MWEKSEKKVLFFTNLEYLKRSQINIGEDVWKRQATPLTMSHFVRVRDFVKRWHLHQIPMGQKCCEYLASSQVGENSRSSTNFQDSEDVGEDVISSLG